MTMHTVAWGSYPQGEEPQAAQAWRTVTDVWLVLALLLLHPTSNHILAGQTRGGPLARHEKTTSKLVRCGPEHAVQHRLETTSAISKRIDECLQRSIWG